MFVVGIARLAGPLQDEAPLLAADLGMTAYDARLLLAPGLPAIVLLTPDRSRALDLLTKVRGRGHDALAFDTQAVIPSESMVRPRQLTLHDEGLTSGDPNPEHLRFVDIFLLLRTTHETSSEASHHTTKKEFSASRAVLTGGLVVRKKTTETSTTHAYGKLDVLYIYPRAGQRPWLLQESGTRYLGLGDRLAATERANFLTAVELIRSHASGAAYDDRLVGRKIPERLAQFTIQTLGVSDTRVASSTASAMDLLCHFVAMWHSKQAG
jgi:hypothetical protein